VPATQSLSTSKGQKYALQAPQVQQVLGFRVQCC
jgi:hypothetical protein